MRLQGIFYARFYFKTLAYENQKVAGSNPAGATIEMQTPQRIAVFFYFPGNKCQFGMGNIWGRF